MKKIAILFTALLFGTGILAQEKMEHKMKDCVMMKDGKMMVCKAGKTMEMSEDMTMKNGTVVMKDGSVKMKDGKMMKMKEGEVMYMDGKMSKMKMEGKKDKM